MKKTLLILIMACTLPVASAYPLKLNFDKKPPREQSLTSLINVGTIGFTCGLTTVILPILIPVILLNMLANMTKKVKVTVYFYSIITGFFLFVCTRCPADMTNTEVTVCVCSVMAGFLMAIVAWCTALYYWARGASDED